MDWDVAAYEAFRTHRERPFLDLMARVPDGARSVLDAGCGTGRTTRSLAARFPGAEVLGVDASRGMLAQAPSVQGVRFEQADLVAWRPARRFDLVVANAVLHWLPDPEATLCRFASFVAPGGTLAVQVPANFEAPSHRAVRALAAEPAWAGATRVAAGDHVLALEGYASVLEDEGCKVEAWETTYRMRLPGDDAVLRWLEGTTLRPFQAALGPRFEAFRAALARRLREAYPPDARGTVFPFTRRFAVATSSRR